MVIFHLYSGYGQVNITKSEWYSCHSMALADSVRPPEARKDRKSRSRHSCNAPDCTHRRTRCVHGWSSFEKSKWDTGSEPRCQNSKHQENIVKRLKSGFELDHMHTYKEYDDPVSVNDINESKSYP